MRYGLMVVVRTDRTLVEGRRAIESRAGKLPTETGLIPFDGRGDFFSAAGLTA
jgi:hypothetical protein